MTLKNNLDSKNNPIIKQIGLVKPTKFKISKRFSHRASLLFIIYFRKYFKNKRKRYIHNYE